MIRICPSCHAKNRIPAEHLADQGRCGACKFALDRVAEPLDVTTTEFDEIIGAARVPVLVDFWADWCGPCKMAAPEVKTLAKEMAGRALILKVDTQTEQGLAMRYQVQSIPNFVVFRGGKPVFQRAGMAPRAEMRRWLEAGMSESAGR